MGLLAPSISRVASYVVVDEVGTILLAYSGSVACLLINLRLGCSIIRSFTLPTRLSRAAPAVVVRGTISAKPTLRKRNMSGLTADLADVYQLGNGFIPG